MLGHEPTDAAKMTETTSTTDSLPTSDADDASRVVEIDRMRIVAVE